MQEYPLNSYGKSDELVKTTFTKYAPTLIGKSWYYVSNIVVDVDGDWLEGRKANLALVKERQIALKAYKDAFLIALARTEQDLKDGV